MAKDRTNFQYFVGMLVILAAMFMANEKAFGAYSPAQINCETSFGEKSFSIDGNTIAFHKEDTDQNRAISSVSGVKKARTHKRLNGFTKVVYVDGNKHKIHIADTTNFSEVNDYMTVVSPKGHKMTYPITCSL